MPNVFINCTGRRIVKWERQSLRRVEVIGEKRREERKEESVMEGGKRRGECEVGQEGVR